MTAGLVVTAVLAGAVIGAWLELPVSRVPEKVPVRDGPWFGHDAIGWRARPVLLSVVTAMLFGAVAIRFGADWALPAFLVLTAGAIALTAIDLETYLLPNRIVYPLTLTGVVLLGGAALGEGTWNAYLRAMLGGLASISVFAILHIISPRALGFGDVKFSFVLGAFLGWLGWGEVVLGFFLGFMYGAVVGIALMLVRRRGRKDPVPFGPFLVAGAMTAILWGAEILDWYAGT